MAPKGRPSKTWAHWEEELALFISKYSSAAAAVKADEFSKFVGRAIPEPSFRRRVTELQDAGRVAPSQLPEERAHILLSDPLCFGEQRINPMGRFTSDELELLRLCFNEPGLTTSQEKAQRYNSLTGRLRDEQSIVDRYNALVAEEASEAQPTARVAFREVWGDMTLSLEDRIKQLNSSLPQQSATSSFGGSNDTNQSVDSPRRYTIEEAAAIYSSMIKSGRAEPSWPPVGVSNEGGESDADGPWQEHEVKYFVQQWLSVGKHSGLKEMDQICRDLLGYSGNDRSLCAMEVKWREITGIANQEFTVLYQMQLQLNADSPFRRGQYRMDGWSKLEDNALRRVCRKDRKNVRDWEAKRTEWMKYTNKLRSAQELSDRFHNVINTQQPYGNDSETYIRRPLETPRNYDPKDAELYGPGGVDNGPSSVS